MTQDSTGTVHYTTQPNTEPVGEGSRRLRVMRRVEGDFGEEQQGIRNGRGTAVGMHVLRQMVD